MHYKIKIVSGVVNGQRYKAFLFSKSILNVIVAFQNALLKNHTMVTIKKTRQNLQLVSLLEKEGFIEKWSVSPKKELPEHTSFVLRVFFKYHQDGSRVLTEILTVSPKGQKGFSKLFSIPTDTWVFCSPLANLPICVISRKLLVELSFSSIFTVFLFYAY